MKDVAKYRKKPGEIEAAQLQEWNAVELADWCNGTTVTDTNPDGSDPMTFVQITDSVGTAQAAPGDFILRTPGGKFLRCPAVLFEAIYELQPDESAEDIVAWVRKVVANARGGLPEDYRAAVEMLYERLPCSSNGEEAAE